MIFSGTLASPRNHLLEYLLENGDPFKMKELSTHPEEVEISSNNTTSNSNRTHNSSTSVARDNTELISGDSFYDDFEFNQDLIEKPNSRENEYDYLNSNCFGRNANNPANNKMSILYRDCQRLNKHKEEQLNSLTQGSSN